MINFIGVTIPYEFVLIGLGIALWSYLRRTQSPLKGDYFIPSLAIGIYFLTVSILGIVFKIDSALFLVLGATFTVGSIIARHWGRQAAKNPDHSEASSPQN